MKEISEEKLTELQNVISKMPLELFCSVALSELGLDWKNVVDYITQNRLALNPKSVGKVVRQYAASNIDEDNIKDIISILKLKVAIKNTPKWHTINMEERIFGEEQVSSTIKMLPTRILHAARRIVRMSNGHPQVHTTRIGDFIYFSLQVDSTNKSLVIYMAFIANDSVAFVNTLANKRLIQAAVEGIGYKNYTNAELYGPDINSLYKIIDRNVNENINSLTEPPVYRSVPVVTKTGIDCTNRAYTTDFIDNLLGPDPPLLNQLEVTCTKPFFDATVLNGNMRITLQLKSENVAETLKSWVVDKVIGTESGLLNVFHLTKSNKVVYDCTRDDSGMV